MVNLTNALSLASFIGGTGRPICGRPSKSDSAIVPVFPVVTNQAKDVVLNRLKDTDVGPAYWHIPETMDAECC